MKRMIALTLVFTLLSSGACFAADTSSSNQTESVSISVSNIKDLWMAHSPDYVKLKGDLFISGDSFRDASNALDRANDADNYALSNTLFNGRDQAKLALDVAAAQKNAKIENAVLSAKQCFLLCLQDQWNLKSTMGELTQKQAQLSKNGTGVQNGFLSQKAYNDLKNSVDDLQNKANNLKNKLNTDETTLKSKLGLPITASIQYTSPVFNQEFFESLTKVDPAADLKSTQANSVTLKVLKITYDSLETYRRSYATSSQVASAELNLNNAKATLPATYTTQYQRLTSQYQDLQNEYRKLSVEKDKLSKMEQQFQKGFVSSLSLNNAKLDFSTLEASVKVKECVLYDTYLSYTNMVAGN